MTDIDKCLFPSWWPNNMPPTKAEIWQEDWTWYMELEYNYEKDGSEYCLRIPKISLGTLGIKGSSTEFQSTLERFMNYIDFNFGSCLMRSDEFGRIFYLEEKKCNIL